MVALENITTAAFTAVALAIFLVSLRAWWHTRSQKILLLTIGFAIFFAKGVFFTLRLFTTPDGWWWSRVVPGLYKTREVRRAPPGHAG